MTKTTEQPVKRMSVADPELQSMAKIDAILADLDESQQARVLAWLMGRYTRGKFRLIIGADGAAPEPGGPS